jgi:hypothetical protein
MRDTNVILAATEGKQSRALLFAAPPPRVGRNNLRPSSPRNQ